MRRFGPALTMIVALVLSVAEPAMAGRGFFEWLDRLSGPGPLKGAGVEIVIYCQRDRPRSGAEADSPFIPPLLNLGGWFDGDCYAQPSGKQVIGVNLGIAQLKSGANPGDGGPVEALVLAPSVDFRITRAVDLGAGFGFIRFRPIGQPHAFDTFWKPYAQIMRVTVRPLMFVDQPRPWRAFLTVNARLDAFGAFDPGAFGPTPRDLPAEIVSSFGIGIDVWTLLRHR
jgi:hypothetical protein